VPLLNTLSRRNSFGRGGGGSAPALFPFTTFTFNTAGCIGRYGPTLAQMQSAYSSASWSSNTNYFNQGRAQGYQVFTIPKTGSYIFDIAGAAGQTGASSGNYSYGARIRATINLISGDKIEMVIGQRGGTTGAQSTGSSAAGAGGGTFVVYNGTTTPLIIAGGGAGTYSTPHSSTFWNGQTRQQPRWDGYNFSPAVLGSNPRLGYGGCGYHGGGGGGLLGSGDGYPGYAYTSASSADGTYTHGGAFNAGGPVSSYAVGGGYTGYADVTGGFGGGGGGHSGNNSGGGGGGYSGGHGGQTGYGGSYLTGIGGGSYIIAGANNVSTSDGNFDGSSIFNGVSIGNIGYNNGHGFVTITAI
jgi:hypothetical protein